jgi:hypothetical protein
MAFDLSSIRRGKALQAPRVFLYSTHGIGKSTFAASAPSPIFICTEDGLGSIDTASFPLAKSSDDVLSAIKSLYTEDHDFKTVVLDSADWLEAMLQREIESKYDAKELAFGKGTLILADKWRGILDGLNALRNDKNMIVVIIGHTEIKRFDSPEVEPYDRYQPKLQARASALVQEWADAVLFANYRTIVKKDDVGFNKTVARGITTGERLLYTSETPAYLAKNRYGLPPVLPLSWDAFSDALTASAS